MRFENVCNSRGKLNDLNSSVIKFSLICRFLAEKDLDSRTLGIGASICSLTSINELASIPSFVVFSSINSLKPLKILLFTVPLVFPSKLVLKLETDKRKI